MSGMLRYLCATGTERILDNSSTKKPCSQITFLAGQLHLLLQDSCGVDSRLGSRSRSYWCCVTDGAGDRPCPAQGAWYTCKGMKGGSSRNLD